MEKEYFNSIEELYERCASAKEKRNTAEIVELWTPCYLNDKEKKREGHIEILREDGYYDLIYFKIGDEQKMKEVYKELETKYNRPVTPLEKYHASF